MTQKVDIGDPKPLSTGFWRLLFKENEGTQPADPVHCDAPQLRSAEIAAVYTGQRVAGDFYEFLRVGPSRMLFVLLDVAGLRADTREVLVALQKKFRTLSPILFAGDGFNEITAMIELCHEMNRTILQGSVRSCPAFMGCYNEDFATVCYANSGHTPGLFRDRGGVTLLEATGLPLGLFSHAPQNASICHLLPGSALLVISRGIIEADCKCDDGDAVEFGLDRAKQILQDATVRGPRDLCLTILQATRQFTRTAQTHNDLTALALVRHASNDAV